ncbi:MAG: hypothetical protein ACE14T_10110 [Syntrophales bacterium]
MWYEELVEQLKKTPRAERSRVIKQYNLMTGKSPQHLYRIAKRHGFNTGRTSRSDKGTFRSGITPQLIEGVASLLHVTGRENKGPIMPMEVALEIAERNGWIEPGTVSVSTMNRILRDHLISKKHLRKPSLSTQLRSLHPNHTHLFDVSVCIQFYLKGNKGLQIMDERKFYKNKPQNFAKIKERLLRYVLVDHFSGAYYFKYYSTTGETQENLYDFLREAWREKEHGDKFPFRGVPFVMLMDTGSANTSKAIVELLNRLDVEVPPGTPHNPRRQGAVEQTHRIIEERFESKLRIQPASDVEELNSWAQDFMVKHQATKQYTRTKMPRTQCWLLITEEQLRELPEESILHDLYVNPEEDRTVNADGTISYRGNEYYLKHIQGIFPGAKVKVQLKPYKWPTVDVSYREVIYEATPLSSLPASQGAFNVRSAIIGQQYKAQPETTTRQAVKRMENMAYGEDRKKDQAPFAGLRVMGGYADEVDVTFLMKKGTPMEIDRSIADKEISFMQFLKNLTQRVGAISKEQNRLLQETFGATIDKAKAEEVIRQFEEDGYEHVGRGTWGVKDTEVANQ